jgi:hypothetical protein
LEVKMDVVIMLPVELLDFRVVVAGMAVGMPAFGSSKGMGWKPVTLVVANSGTRLE